ncbi:MAG TPA: quinone-dependent dihydroorotate dehydrogenase [Myxococcota bacterium]|nr:quinone-dependent dihydroorotate dehydrogenase [Myxococcota bacterium]
MELDIKSANNKKTGRLWRLLRPLAFSFDAEQMHESAIWLLKLKSWLLEGTKPAQMPAFYSLKKDLMGLHFKNPIGLAAGFDVDALCLPALEELGFGFIEVGGVTEHAQLGNPKPRIFRLPKDNAIINRLNFYNAGANRLRTRLADLRNKKRIEVPIGINLGKSNHSSLEEVPREYARTFQIVSEVADYITINISCPNTEGLQRYQTAESLGLLLDRVCNVNENLAKKLPLLLKLGPDLSNEEAIACAEIAVDYRLAGLIISNTTHKRNGLITSVDYGKGGLSGQPLFERSTQLLRCVAKDYGGRLVLIGSGGIMDGGCALAKLHAGASLLQVYTGLIYGGPDFVWELLQYLEHSST